MQTDPLVYAADLMSWHATQALYPTPAVQKRYLEHIVLQHFSI